MLQSTGREESDTTERLKNSGPGAGALPTAGLTQPLRGRGERRPAAVRPRLCSDGGSLLPCPPCYSPRRPGHQPAPSVLAGQSRWPISGPPHL